MLHFISNLYLFRKYISLIFFGPIEFRLVYSMLTSTNGDQFVSMLRFISNVFYKHVLSVYSANETLPCLSNVHHKKKKMGPICLPLIFFTPMEFCQIIKARFFDDRVYVYISIGIYLIYVYFICYMCRQGRI